MCARGTRNEGPVPITLTFSNSVTFEAEFEAVEIRGQLGPNEILTKSLATGLAGSMVDIAVGDLIKDGDSSTRQRRRGTTC